MRNRHIRRDHSLGIVGGQFFERSRETSPEGGPTLFAAVALLLAAIGTYGVLSVLVAERRHEIGIRMALGADRSRVLVGIMRHGLLLTGIGVVIGLAGAFGLSRLIASLLFGVSPADAVTMIGVVALVILVAAVACLRPALRASRLDPNVVLRVG